MFASMFSRRKRGRLIVVAALACAAVYLVIQINKEEQQQQPIAVANGNAAAGEAIDRRAVNEQPADAAGNPPPSPPPPPKPRVNPRGSACPRDSMSNYPGASKYRMHGNRIGLYPDGRPGWTPSPRPMPGTYNMADELKGNGFFYRLSESMPLDRNVTDRRHHMCEADLKTYDLSTMPQTSVVFVFYNEAMSTLLRSIHSVLNRSPPELLCEIILVDDHSDHEWLGAPLEEYIKLLPKVRLIRMPVRGGLVKARLKGAEEARAETFTVLDSHIEVEPGWLEPIMHRMREPTRIIMPQIDTTNPETIIGSSGGIGCTLGFLWSLVEHAIDVQPKDKAKRKSPIDPVPSPTHAGGLFTANKEYFFHIGGYDRDFGFWGTENLEFSFRIWQCGGTLECAPCSRVYHIFRKGGHAWSMPGNHLAKNKLRTAAIWMDEYGAVVRESLGNPKNVDIGPLDDMLALRKRLKCKSFDWFLKNVYPMSPITDMSDIYSLGYVQNNDKHQCWDQLGNPGRGGKIGVYGCHGQGGPQAFIVMKNTIRPIVNLELCLGSDFVWHGCGHGHFSDAILWDFDDGLIRHRKNQKCVQLHNYQLITTDCKVEDPSQLWETKTDWS